MYEDEDEDYECDLREEYRNYDRPTEEVECFRCQGTFDGEVECDSITVDGFTREEWWPVDDEPLCPACVEWAEDAQSYAITISLRRRRGPMNDCWSRLLDIPLCDIGWVQMRSGPAADTMAARDIYSALGGYPYEVSMTIQADDDPADWDWQKMLGPNARVSVEQLETD